MVVSHSRERILNVFFILKVCLGELGRAPGPELENWYVFYFKKSGFLFKYLEITFFSSTDRESYSLSAGLALGMITFGKGKKITFHNSAIN